MTGGRFSQIVDLFPCPLLFPSFTSPIHSPLLTIAFTSPPLSFPPFFPFFPRGRQNFWMKLIPQKQKTGGMWLLKGDNCMILNSIRCVVCTLAIGTYTCEGTDPWGT